MAAAHAIGLRLVLALLVGTICVAAGHLRYVDGEGNVHGDNSVVPTAPVAMPSHVVVVKDGYLFELRKRNDVVVLAVTTKYGCDGCDKVLADFAGAAAQFRPDQSIAFGMLDAHEEADEFHALLDEHPDFEWMVPSLLILKHDIQTVRRKPPFSYLLNERTGEDLPKFLHRLLGSDVRLVKTPAELFERVHHPGTERVSITLLADRATEAVRDAFYRVAADERLHIFFNELAGPSEGVDAGGSNRPIVALISDGASVVLETLTWSPGSESSSSFSASIRAFVERAKTRRPGHEFDGITRVTTHTPAGQCTGKVVAKRRDRVKVAAVGVNLHTGTEFYSKNVTIDVGMGSEFFPSTMPKDAFVGLCEGANTTVAFPPHRHWSGDHMPINVDKEDVIKYQFHVLALDVTTDGAAGSEL